MPASPLPIVAAMRPNASLHLPLQGRGAREFKIGLTPRTSEFDRSAGFGAWSRGILLALPLLFAANLCGAESASRLVSLTYSGDQQSLETLDRDINAAGNHVAKLATIEQTLLGVLRRPEATFAARQAVAQRLGLILAAAPAKTTADAFKPLGSMLSDEPYSDLARLALEPVNSEVVDALFNAALEKTSGRTRLGLIDSISRRRTASAVPFLTKLLRDPDPATVSAAAKALGEIADPTAAAALQALPEPSPAPIAAAKLAAASRVPPAAALGLLTELQQNARDPVHRAAAWRQSLDLEAGGAAAKIAAALDGDDLLLRQVALESLTSARAPNLVSTLIAKLDSWDAATQEAVITALGRRREVAATGALVRATTHASPEVRAAAAEALGVLPGNREIAARLATMAAESESEDGKAARQALARLSGAEVITTIAAGAERGTPKTRAVYLEQLALRQMTDAIPTLLKVRADPDVAVRVAAVGALGELASASEQKALLDWTLEATDSTEQARALRSLVNVTLRDPAVEERGRPIFAVIEYAQPELALRLLPALGRIGGVASAESAARLAIRDDAQVSEAALNALNRWSDESGLSGLATVAEKAVKPATRIAALDGVLRYFERNRDDWQPETTTLVARLLATAKDDDVRKKLVTLLHRANDRKALALLESLKADAALAGELAIAGEVVRANLAGPATVRASSSAGISNVRDGKTSTRWTTPALGDEWVEVDFKVGRPITRVILDQTGRAAEFPEQYEVFVTNDLAQPGKALVTGTGQRTKTTIDLPAGTRGRYLIVRNVAERKDTPWAICELYVD